jgi:hypothetical protein
MFICPQKKTAPQKAPGPQSSKVSPETSIPVIPSCCALSSLTTLTTFLRSCRESPGRICCIIYLLHHLESIDGPELYSHTWIYGSVSPVAFYYYLPAFLIVAMNLDRVDVVGADLLYYLGTPEKLSEYRRQFVSEVTSRLTPQQRAAIQQWAYYLMRHFSNEPQIKDLAHWL